MNQYRFSTDQRGTLFGTVGPLHTLNVTLLKNPVGGVHFEAAKAGALATLRREEHGLLQHPEELRGIRKLIARVEALDEGTADLMPDGENAV